MFKKVKKFQMRCAVCDDPIGNKDMLCKDCNEQRNKRREEEKEYYENQSRTGDNKD